MGAAYCAFMTLRTKVVIKHQIILVYWRSCEIRAPRLYRARRRTQIFYAVARCGTVVKAAAQLGVSQPTVTGQLRQLESRYGVELFHRRRGMRLSDAGHSLMPMVEKLVQQETEIDFRCATPATCAKATCGSAPPDRSTSWTRCGGTTSAIRAST